MNTLLATLSIDEISYLQLPLHLLHAMPFYAYAVLILFLGKLFYERTSSFSFIDELTERDNPAFGACLAGYMVGLAVALTGAFPSNSEDYRQAAIDMTTSGVLAILLLRAGIWINDKLILNHFSINVEMLRDHNIGTGAAVAGSCIGTGLVLAGALTGNSDGWAASVRDTVIYWAVGQLVFIAGALAFYRTAGYNVQETLENDNNTAAGISLGGFLAALGILLWSVLQNSANRLADQLLLILVMASIGIPLLLFSSIIVEKLILHRINLPKEIVIDKNSAAGLICAAASLGTAILLAATIFSH